MPFKLWYCDKIKLNQVVDQVKTLSETVDELREEINSLKTCFIETSVNDDSKKLYKKIDRENEKNCQSTFQKWKKCLEKTFYPFISTDTGFRVKKKCKQIFCPSADIPVPFPVQLSSGESTLPGEYSSLLSCKKISKLHESCQTSNSKIPKRNYPKNICKNSKKISTVESNFSIQSLKKCDKELRRTRCTYEFCNDVTPSATREIGTQNCRKNSSEFSNCLPIFNCSNKEKKSIGVEAVNSSTSCNLPTSNTSGDDLLCSKIRYKEAKRNYKRRKILENKNARKKSKSIGCTSGCPYGKKPRLRNISTNTLHENTARDRRKFEKIVRAKRLKSQKTQTRLKLKKNIQDPCMDEEYYPRSVRTKREHKSLTSLTSSCLPRSDDEECKTRDDDEIEKKKNLDESKTVYRKKRWKKKSGRKNETGSCEVDGNSTMNRKKRTYVISSVFQRPKNDATVECNFYDDRNSSYPEEDSSFSEKKIWYTKSRKKRTKPEVASKVSQNKNCRSEPSKKMKAFKKEKKNNLQVCDSTASSFCSCALSDE